MLNTCLVYMCNVTHGGLPGAGAEKRAGGGGLEKLRPCIQGTWWQTVLEPSNPSSYHPQSSTFEMKTMGTMPGNYKALVL